MAQNEASRACMFCDSPADSREHVFALRLCSRAGAEKYPVIAGLSVEGRENVIRPPHIVQNVQVRHVCARCNNEWMNDLEEWFESRLGFLIEPDWPGFAFEGIIQALKSERDKLAHWLMKTAVTFSLATIQGENPVEFSRAVTHNVKNGILPKNCWVDLAFSKSVPTKVGGTMTRHFNVINGGKPMTNQVLKNGDGFKFVVQFNHLLLSIAQAPSANVTYQGRGQIPIRIYPTPPPRMPIDFAYENLVEFQHCVILETWAGCEGNIH